MLISIQVPDEVLYQIDELIAQRLTAKDDGILRFSQDTVNEIKNTLRAATDSKALEFLKANVLFNIGTKAKPAPGKTNRTRIINELLLYALRGFGKEREYQQDELAKMVVEFKLH